MPRNITITFNDGASHRYENIPDNVTPDMIEARANKDFPGKRITNIDGGKKASQGSELDQVKKNAGVNVDINKVFKDFGSAWTAPTTFLKQLPLNQITQDQLITALGDPESAKTIGSTTMIKYRWGSTVASVSFTIKNDIVVDAMYKAADEASDSGRMLAGTGILTKAFGAEKGSMWSTEPVTAKQLQGK